MKRLTVERVTVGIALAIAVLRLVDPAALELLDLKTLDIRHTVRGQVAPSGEVVVVGIDEPSLAALGRWPWPRSRLARLFDRLTEAGVSVIGVDVFFDEADTSVDLAALREAVAADPTRRAADLLPALLVERNDEALAAALRRSGRVVLGHFAEFGDPPSPTLADDAARVAELSVRAIGGADPAHTPFLKEATRVHGSLPALTSAVVGAGHINFFPSADGLYRRVPLAIRAGGRLLPSLSLEVLRHHLGGQSATMTVGADGVVDVHVGHRSIPVDGAGQLWINCLGPPGTFTNVSAADVLARRVAPGVLAGKVVLVGFTAAGFDKVATPFAPAAAGVELHANAIDNMLVAASLRRPWWTVPVEAAVAVLLGVVLGIALRRLRVVGGVATATAIALGYLWLTQRLFTTSGIVLGAVYPLITLALATLGGAVFQAVIEEREKRAVRDAFRHYLNPEVTELIASHPEHLRLGGERREITVLFSDIPGFTGFSEVLEPEALGEVLNDYLGAMTEVVFRHQGLLDKYIGDAVMALWGAPAETPDHALRCCTAALDMVAGLDALHARWRGQGMPLFDVRIGINTGEAVVGNFGAAHRFSYTAIGSEVNLASRLEGLNKQYGTSIMMSESTRRAVGDAFVCRELDRVRVKGIAQPVAVYELLGRPEGDHGRDLARRAEVYGAALAAYRRRAWQEAIEILRALSREFPGDRALAPFLQRCHALWEAAPGEDWDAISEQLMK